MTYAQVSDVQARNPYRVIDGSSKPTTTQVDTWILEAEALLHGALNAGQCVTPITGGDGIKLMRSWACDYAEGHVRQAYAAAGGDGNNDDGKDLLERFDARLQDILDNPARYSSMLNGGSAASGTSHFRSHITDDVDGRTRDDDGFQPAFTKADAGDQF